VPYILTRVNINRFLARPKGSKRTTLSLVSCKKQKSWVTSYSLVLVFFIIVQHAKKPLQRQTKS